ncbi:MAG: hypothetical protein V4515_14725 [Chloroflexota bacterium]
MTFIHGKDTYLSLDGNDLSPFSNTSSWEDSSDKHDVTCYGANRKAFAYGLGDGKLSFGGVYDNTAAGPKAVIEAIKDARENVTLIRRPEGTGSGRPQESVDVLVEKYSESSPVADMVTWSCDLQPSGDITRTTQ